MCGLKVLKVFYDDYVTFIDSLNFLPFALKKFPSTFGLKNMCKGWYPHFFNTTENYDYVGPIPDKKYFGEMAESERDQFNSWHISHIENNFVFHNRIELVKYCANDVTLLRTGCTKYMQDFLKATSINPFLQSFTLSQAVMKVFRKNFLEKNVIGITPRNLYKTGKPQSIIGSKWLIYISQKSNIKLEREYNLPTTKLFVDGYCTLTRTIYEFLGCYYYGCRKCFINTRYASLNDNETIETRYKATCLRLSYIKSLGFNLIYIWECSFIDELKKNLTIETFLTSELEFNYSFIDPRDAVYGGRTETFKLYHKTEPYEKIVYLDFTSLYPYINKYCKNPIGHPKIFRNSDCVKINLTEVDGFIRCKILAPTNLYLPVLPCRIGGKLMFSLCFTCAYKLNVTDKCSHDISERCLTGTWVIAEVNLAIMRGYTLLETKEIWIYETLQYDPVCKEGGLFTGYMNHFLKIKQEATGWPSMYMTETEKSNYIELYYNKEGIKLEYSKIKKNPSSRTMSKQSANSLWGKFCQKENLSLTTVIQNENDLFELLLSVGLEIVDVICVSDETVWVNWKYKSNQYLEPLGHNSIPIGALTTANARIKLYLDMEKVGESILYCDTDSIIYVQNDTESQKLNIGNFLGDLTNELESYGEKAFITVS